MYDAPDSWTTAFTREVYFRPDKNRAVLVRYIGDETVAGHFAHGNSKNSTQVYERTQPHVLVDIREAPGTPVEVYEASIRQTEFNGESSTPAAGATVRNLEQVRNAQKLVRNKGRMSRDALYNLHELAYDTQFVKHITTFPDLAVYVYHTDAVTQFKTVVAKCVADDISMILSYDTTFQLGDFFVSPLVFQDMRFNPPPTVPLAYLIHERKTKSVHEEFFRHVYKLLPGLDGCERVFFVTDNEAAIVSSIRETFRCTSTFLCWNHLEQVI